MSKEITCDICGIKMGVQLERASVQIRFNDPSYNAFYAKEKEFDDVCKNCEHELRQAVMKTVDRLKSDASLGSGEQQ